MAISSRNTLLAALAFIAFQAQAVNVTVAYHDPTHVIWTQA